jgi:hypothetical protein
MVSGYTYNGRVPLDKWNSFNAWLDTQSNLHRFGLVTPYLNGYDVTVRFAKADKVQIAKLKSFGLREL